MYLSSGGITLRSSAMKNPYYISLNEVNCDNCVAMFLDNTTLGDFSNNVSFSASVDDNMLFGLDFTVHVKGSLKFSSTTQRSGFWICCYRSIN